MTTDWRADRLRVPVDTWLDVLREEYLDGFVSAGGAAVRFVSGTPEVLHQARSRLTELARHLGYHVVALYPGTLTAAGRKPDYHHMDRFFFGVTSGVEWRDWADRQTRRLLAEMGVSVPEGQSLERLDEIAEANGRDRQDLVGEYQRKVTERQVRDRAMEYEFRAAVTALGRARLFPEKVSPTTEEVLLAWLRGQSLPGGPAALKRIHIFSKVNATNARHMLRSFCRWLPQAGGNGLVVVLDFRPYERKSSGLARRSSDLMRQLAQAKEALTAGRSRDEVLRLLDDGDGEPVVTYSDQAYRAMMALLRRFIDETDLFERFLLVVLTTPGYYDEAAARNYHDYDALQTRIGLEVRDARRPNPAAALVHLGDPQ